MGNKSRDLQTADRKNIKIVDKQKYVAIFLRLLAIALVTIVKSVTVVSRVKEL